MWIIESYLVTSITLNILIVSIISINFMNSLILTHLIIGRSLYAPLNMRINYVFNAGTPYYLAGNNGSGKTTLMRTLCGYLTPLAGNISVNNLSNVAGYYGHDNALKHNLTVANYLNLCCKIFENTHKPDYLIDIFQLTNLLPLPISYLSCGQKRRVSLVAFLICERNIYCFDEASSGLDNNFRTIFYDYMVFLATEKQKIIIFSDHINPLLSQQKLINLHDFNTETRI